MNWLDAVVVAAAVLAVVVGWRRGFVRRACSLAGFLGALIAMAYLVPQIMPADTVTASRFVATVGVVWLAALAGSTVGSAAGRFLEPLLVRGSLRPVDKVAGAALGVVTVVLAAWVVVPTMKDVPGWPAVSARNSATAAVLDSSLGQPPEFIDALGQALRVGSLARVFEDGKSPDIDRTAPPQPVSDAVLARARRSVVRIESDGCKDRIVGSGFFVAPGLVITNAHVVAGTTETKLRTTDGAVADAVVVYFDPEQAIALLSTDMSDRPALELRPAQVDDVGSIIGFPGGGDMSFDPFAVADVVDTLGRDLYGQRARREILVLAARVVQGESGGPLVGVSGEVIGMVYAYALDRPAVAYAVTVDAIRNAVTTSGRRQVSTERCV